MAQASAGHVFISYSRKDKAVMQRIAKYLQERAINLWVDNEELVPGTPSWEEEIEKAIRGASAVIVLLSPHSIKSKWVRREISFADDNNVRIFPVLIRGDEKALVTLRLNTIQHGDIRQNEEIGLAALLTAMTQHLKTLEIQVKQGDEETENQVPEIGDEEEAEEVRAELTPATKWKIEKVIVPIVVAVITILGPVLFLVFSRFFLEGASTQDNISTPANMLAPVPNSTITSLPATILSVTFTPPPVCRPLDNQPPSIHLTFVPRSVRINFTADLTISVNDPENDAYEILSITAEKGEFPNGKEEPYLYIAPGLPDKDTVTVWVGDHECQTKEEITITITQ